MECNKIQQKFYPKLFLKFMQEMTIQFNNETVTKNLYCFMDSDAKNYFPHGYA